jgi:hypothetical protein
LIDGSEGSRRGRCVGGVVLMEDGNELRVLHLVEDVGEED